MRNFPRPQLVQRYSYSKVIASGVDPDIGSVIQLGSGMATSQASGNLLLTTGTTINAETIVRMKASVEGPFSFRQLTTLSQRIANQSFYAELVDLIGDGLPFVINSAVSVTVKFPNGHGFDSTNVGQSMSLGAIQGAAGVPGRYAIASVSGNFVTFTVSGWPANGDGTLSAFGYNFHRITYDGASGLVAKYDAGRRGWASGDTSITTLSSASPGHMTILNVEDGVASIADQLVASSTTLQVNVRGSRVANIPDPETTLYLQFRAVNGTVAPASTTTWTVGLHDLQDYVPQQVSITSIRPMSGAEAMPVKLWGPQTPSIISVGQLADDSAAGSVAPVITGGKARNANITAVSATGDAVSQVMTMVGVSVVKPFSIPEADWAYVAAASGIVNTTTAVTIKASAGAGLRNYITGIDLATDGALGAATEVAIRDGASGPVLWRMKIGTGGLQAGRNIIFPSPIKGTAATLLEVVTLTASVTGAVYFNANGYAAP